MKRVLIDYKKLPKELAIQLINAYPGGYGDDDIIAFKNHKGELIEAVELQTPEALYLVKISQSLSLFIDQFEIETTQPAADTAIPENKELLESELEGELDYE